MFLRVLPVRSMNVNEPALSPRASRIHTRESIGVGVVQNQPKRRRGKCERCEQPRFKCRLQTWTYSILRRRSLRVKGVAI